jgi:hypothetical protein
MDKPCWWYHSMHLMCLFFFVIAIFSIIYSLFIDNFPNLVNIIDVIIIVVNIYNFKCWYENYKQFEREKLKHFWINKVYKLYRKIGE